MLNPGSLKQALVEGAVRLPDLNMYEQGNGRINLPNSQKILASYSPRASIIPPAIDFTDCPYMWPYCTQPLYAFGLPVAFNATIVNGMAVTGSLVDPPVFKPTDEGGRLLHVNFQHSEVIWPWAGYLAIFVEVSNWMVCAQCWLTITTQHTCCSAEVRTCESRGSRMRRGFVGQIP
jgi:membrane-bound transcription factor site-1 protease